MIWLVFVALVVGAVAGAVLTARHLEAWDASSEYEEAIEELGRALREAYAFIHVAGEWDEFERTGFTIDPPAPTAISDGERREIRAARARARDQGMSIPARGAFGRDAPLGHTRVGIDHPVRRGEGRVFTRPVDPRGANPGQAPNEWGELGRIAGDP